MATVIRNHYTLTRQGGKSPLQEPPDVTTTKHPIRRPPVQASNPIPVRHMPPEKTPPDTPNLPNRLETQCITSLTMGGAMVDYPRDGTGGTIGGKSGRWRGKNGGPGALGHARQIWLRIFPCEPVTPDDAALGHYRLQATGTHLYITVDMPL